MRFVVKDGTLIEILDENIVSVTIPDGVTSIGKYVFQGRHDLTSVVIPEGVTSIGYSAFAHCNGLTTITLPNSLTSIGKLAFCGCRNLTSIIIPNSVTSIGDWAFFNCHRLTSQSKNYKAFNLVEGNLFCFSKLFIPMEWSDEIDNIKICERGYHYCTNLFDIFNYYYGELDKDIAIYECNVGDITYSRENEDSKHVTNKIRPVKRLYREDIIRILNGQD